jgi:hypothetical protein
MGSLGGEVAKWGVCGILAHVYLVDGRRVNGRAACVQGAQKRTSIERLGNVEPS